MPYGIPTLIKFPGLDGHPVAIDRAHVLFVDESAVAGEPVVNVHFHNGKWVTVRGTIDEVVAVLSDSSAQSEEKELESYRRQARLRRQAKAEVDAVMRAVAYEGPKPKEWGIETLLDGRRKVTAYLEPVAVPETGPCFNCGEEGARVQFQADGTPLYDSNLWCGKCDVDPGLAQEDAKRETL